MTSRYTDQESLDGAVTVPLLRIESWRCGKRWKTILQNTILDTKISRQQTSSVLEFSGHTLIWTHWFSSSSCRSLLHWVRSARLKWPSSSVPFCCCRVWCVTGLLLATHLFLLSAMMVTSEWICLSFRQWKWPNVWCGWFAVKRQWTSMSRFGMKFYRKPRNRLGLCWNCACTCLDKSFHFSECAYIYICIHMQQRNDSIVETMYATEELCPC